MPGERRHTLGTATATFPMGAAVRYYPVAGEASFVRAHVRSGPWALGHGAIVIRITGRAGGVLVDRLERVS